MTEAADQPDGIDPPAGVVCGVCGKSIGAEDRRVTIDSVSVLCWGCGKTLIVEAGDEAREGRWR